MPQTSNEEPPNGEKKITYRVETFIIPKSNKLFRSTEELDLDAHCASHEEAELLPNAHKTDDVKIARKLKLVELQNSGTPEKSQALSFRSEEDNCPPPSKPLRSQDWIADSNIGGFELERSQSYDFLPSLKHDSGLKSIEEQCEISYTGSCEELTCHHGIKNGCTVAAQSPNQVSEEIFKENWMQRLEFLRQRVSLIRDKEVVLQERERLLLKKEKELRILERLMKEKVQRADLYHNRCTNCMDYGNDPSLAQFAPELRPSPPPYPTKQKPLDGRDSGIDPDSRETGSDSRTSNRSSRSKTSGSTNSTCSESSGPGSLKSLRSEKDCPSEYGKSLKTAVFSFPDADPKPIAEGSTSDFRRSKWSAYSSWRCRARPKITYDDLDSTLSADVGDSSFAVTSKKLDPRLVRKPRGFARSASERGLKNPRPFSLDLDAEFGLEGERVLRKISENILAVAENRETQFQDYGSIDQGHVSQTATRPDVTSKDKKLEGKKGNSCRTEASNSLPAGGKDQAKTRKERTTSFWNEEASDWLRKKRQAYNLATKRMATKDYEGNKENCGNFVNHMPDRDKHSKSKNEKGKKFAIFR